MPLIVRSTQEIEQYLATIQQSSAQAVAALIALANNPNHLFWQMKFLQIGRHPIEDRGLNLVEQINQTWTFVAAFEATRLLLQKHPAQTYLLSPGAHAALRFDIMNTNEDICAETFAAVTPDNNNKLEKDIAKLEKHPDIAHRYVFFISPAHPNTERLEIRERAGIQIWSIACPQWANQLP